MTFSTEIGKKPKIPKDLQKTPNSQEILRKKKKWEASHFLILKYITKL